MSKENKARLGLLAIVAAVTVVVAIACGIACGPSVSAPAKVAEAQQQNNATVEDVSVPNSAFHRIYLIRMANGDRCYYIDTTSGALSCIPAYMPTAGETSNPQKQ